MTNNKKSPEHCPGCQRVVFTHSRVQPGTLILAHCEHCGVELKLKAENKIVFTSKPIDKKS